MKANRCGAAFLSGSGVVGMATWMKAVLNPNPDPARSASKSPVTCCNSSHRNSFILSFNASIFFFVLFFNFTRKTQLASLKCESEQICSPTETHDRGERKNLQMQIFVPWSFKEKPRETRRQESEVHQVCNKQLAATDKRHLVHSIQALQHKIEQLIC